MNTTPWVTLQWKYKLKKRNICSASAKVDHKESSLVRMADQKYLTDNETMDEHKKRMRVGSVSYQQLLQKCYSYF